MIRELQWLYRSCRALMLVVIGVALYSHVAGAQMIDPLSLPDPDGGILHPLVDRGCHGRMLREYGGAARDTFIAKIDGGPIDTSTIVPGDRDFLEPNYPARPGPQRQLRTPSPSIPRCFCGFTISSIIRW
ncbi:MAG: hypothetical protein ABI876_18890 [Bacteroidota bacterium]